MARLGAARLVALAMLGVAVLASCAGGTPDVSTGPKDTAGTTASIGTTPPVPAKCEDPLLLTAVATKYPAATIDDVVCANANAAVTIVGAEAIAGDGVGILVGTSGSWQLAASGPVDADPNTLLPERFSLSVYNSWRDKYEARKNPTPTVSRAPRPGTTAGAAGANEHTRCYKEGDRYYCVPPSTTTTTTAPTTTIPKPTTTPTTAPPPVTEPPTVPPPTTPVVSDFCKANPFNPNCLANPGFPG